MFQAFKPISAIRIGLLAIVLVAFGTAGRAQAQTATPMWPRTLTDSAGNSVTLNAQPTRIVSATLATDEMLFSLVDPSRLAAVTSNATDPTQSNVVDAAKTISNQLKTPLDPEQVIALKPDLVLLASYTDAGALKQLKDAGLPIFLFANFNSIKDVENNVTLLGEAVGAEPQAAQIVKNMETRLKAVADAVQPVKTKLSVIYYSPDGYSDGAGSTIDEVIMRAGGINAVTAGGIKDAYPQLSDEFVVKADPDVILLSGFNNYAPGFVDKFKTNASFQTLKAIKNGHVYVANDAHVASISQYIVNGVEDVAALLYPNNYKLPATPVPTISATVAATAAP
ncbi:MAG: ABC transporter substrate-binding protein [Aggregatilineales bacterium]